MKKELSFETALVHEICPCCHEKMNEQIILPKLLTEKVCNEIKEMHGKAISFADEPCEECKKLIPEYIHIKGIDPEKSGNTVKEVYHTGLNIWLKREVVKNIFLDYEKYEIANLGFMFMEDGLLRQLLRTWKEQNPDLEIPEV